MLSDRFKIINKENVELFFNNFKSVVKNLRVLDPESQLNMDPPDRDPQHKLLTMIYSLENLNQKVTTNLFCAGTALPSSKRKFAPRRCGT